MKRLIFAIALITALAGCSDIEKSDPTVKKLEVVMNIESISADILTYFNVDYVYKDFNGKTVTNSITKPGKISFSIDNPTLGEEPSTPFTVQLSFLPKDVDKKTSGSYDSSINWQLDLNAYDKKGNLITDSGSIQRFSSNVIYDNNKFASFKAFVVSQAKMATITYKTFFCQTISGEWHIGVEGSYNK